ncbi:MAG: hypothetical protein OXT07_00865 [bacterium]|nr:hypothetical protein [bacterium]
MFEGMDALGNPKEATMPARPPRPLSLAVALILSMAAACAPDETTAPSQPAPAPTQRQPAPPEPETDCEASANIVLAEIDLYVAALDRFAQAADTLDIPSAQTAYDETGEHQEEIWWFGADLVSDDCRGGYDDLVAVVDQASRDWTALESV